MVYGPISQMNRLLTQLNSSKTKNGYKKRKKRQHGEPKVQKQNVSRSESQQA